jgi:hypothetical protein
MQVLMQIKVYVAMAPDKSVSRHARPRLESLFDADRGGQDEGTRNVGLS